MQKKHKKSEMCSFGEQDICGKLCFVVRCNESGISKIRSMYKTNIEGVVDDSEYYAEASFWVNGMSSSKTTNIF